MSPPVIAIIGSLNADLITRTPRIPSPGETLNASSFSIGCGGKGANQAVACARLSRTRESLSRAHEPGGNNSNASETTIVRMEGSVGSDLFGQTLIETLTRDGVDTSGVQVGEGEVTGVAVILVEEETGENRILLSPGANAGLRPEAFSSLTAPVPDLLILQLEIPLETVLAILRAAAACTPPVPVLFNPAPATALPPWAYGLVEHLIVNETEAAALYGASEEYICSNLGKVGREFQNRGARNVVMTLGKAGLWFVSGGLGDGTGVGGVEGHVAGVKADVVDTTGAGDTFVGAYAVSVAQQKMEGKGFDIRIAVEWANRAAARAVEKEGAMSSIPWMDEV
jgi:ribokinase